MTILEAVHKIDTVKPNSYTQPEKIKWLSTLDGIIKSEIIDTHEDGENVEFDGYDDETDLDTELLVPSPYDDVYVRWLEARIDYANGEYGKYNNSMVAYNDAYSLFSNYYNRKHMPKGKQFKYFGEPKHSHYQAANSLVKIAIEEDKAID